jgi:hypothetical protein
MLTLALLAHVLVFVYWLGGDLGAFYASTFVIDRNRPLPARIAASQILSAVDMAPRTAMILTLPTGLTLAYVRGWLGPSVPPMALGAVWVIGLGWLAIAWTLHMRHLPGTSPLARLDFYWRVGLSLALVALGFTGQMGTLELETFLRLKLVLLALAIGCGLGIRIMLRPFGPAMGAILRGESTPELEDAIARLMSRARIFVVAIWVIITSAAVLGLSVHG